MNITNLYVAAKSKIFSNKSLKVYIARTLCTALLLLLLSASAATITVDDSGGADNTTIQAAMVDPPDDNPCTIMRPDIETLRGWIERYNAAPRIGISGEGVRALSTLPDNYSVLDRLDYNATERDQGSCGNCWVWAGTGCMEVAHDVENDVFDRLSIQYLNSLYYNGNLTGAGHACCGGTLGKFVDFYSVNTTFAIPWNNTNASWQDRNIGCTDNTNVPADSISTTPHYTITRIEERTITTQEVDNDTAIANIKSVLANDSAVWFAFYLPTSSDWTVFGNFWNDNAEIDLWSPDYSCGHTWVDGGGGHAVLCVGYNDTDQDNRYWIMLNSWGDSENRPNGLFRMNMSINYSCSFDYYGNPEYSLYWQMLDMDFAVPTPTNLQNTTGNYWVNYTWAAGTGIVTDGYNVSMNGGWHNRTETFLNSSVDAGNWSNITVWAYNATGNGNMSVGNVSDNVQAPVAAGEVTVTATNYTAITSTNNTTIGTTLTFQFNTTNTTGQSVPHFINTSNPAVCVNGVPGGFGTITGNGTFTLNSSSPTDYISVTVKNPQNTSENDTLTGIKFVYPSLINTSANTSVYYNNGTHLTTDPATTVYYFFNGSSINITVLTSARMNNVTATSVNITNMTCYNATGANVSGKWQYNLTASNVYAGNETDHNITVNLTFNGYTTTINYPFVALMNFNPIYMGLDLGGSTTDWRTISDFTSVSGLIFEKVVSESSLGVLKFQDPMNLTNLTTVKALQNLGENMAINRSNMVLNSSALFAMNVSSNLTMYNLTFSEDPAIFSGGLVSVTPGNTSGGAVTDLSYSGTTRTLTFNVSHWTDYTVAGLENVSTSVPADNSTNFTLRLNAPAGKVFTLDANVSGCYIDGNVAPYYITVGSGNSVLFNVTRATAGTMCINATNGTTVLNNTYVVFTASADFMPPAPINITNITSNFWVNYSWDPGLLGNETSSYNVSVNDNWLNGSSDFNNTYVGPHNWSNISVYAYNVSGTGRLNLTPLSDQVQVPNNVPIQDVIGPKSVTEGQWLNFTVSATDADFDSITYGTNATNGTLENPSGNFSWLTVIGEAGTYIWYFNSSDDYDGVATETITITINPVATYMPPAPINITNITSNFWVNYSWDPGLLGNETSSYNVSVNDNWLNGSSDFNNTYVGPHNWSNISVYAYNVSGTGRLNLTPLSDQVQVPNNVPIQDVIGPKSVTEGQWLNFTVSATDADFDSITYGTNATNGTLENPSGNFSWLTVIGEAGTYIWYFNSSDDYDGVATETITITINPVATYVPPKKDGGGGGGGGGGASGEAYENIVCTETDRQYVSKDQSVKYNFTLECNYVQHIEFTGLTSAGKVAAKVEMLNHTSTTVDKDAPNIVFKNLNVWVGNMGYFSENNVKDPSITFIVDRSWVNDNDIILNTISFYSHNDDTNTWEKMSTQKIGEDSTSYKFKANLPIRGSLGPMAISGKELVYIPTPAPTPTPTPVITPTLNITENLTLEITSNATPVTWTGTWKAKVPGFQVLAALIALITLYFISRRRD